MRPIHRWSLVALAVALVVLVPITVRALPVPDEAVSARDLLARMQAGDGAGYSGTVEVHGRLGLPVSDHFTDIADLLGSDTRMRVWWRSSDQWRVDKLLPTGEVDLFHHGRATIRWDYERAEARDQHRPSDPAPARRRPAAARAGATGADRCGPGRRHPPRRHAGSPGTTRSGCGYGPATRGRASTTSTCGPTPPPAWCSRSTPTATRRSRRSARRSRASTCSRPASSATSFHAAHGLRQTVDDVLDIADAANQYAPVLPPDTVAGLTKSAVRPGRRRHLRVRAHPGDGAPAAVTRRGVPRRPAPHVGRPRGRRSARSCASGRWASRSPSPTRRSTSPGSSTGTVTDDTLVARARAISTTGPGTADDPDPGAHQAVRRRARRRGPRAGRRRGRRLRLPGAERLRQDHDRADAARTGARHLGLDRGAGPADAGAGARGAAAAWARWSRAPRRTPACPGAPTSPCSTPWGRPASAPSRARRVDDALDEVGPRRGRRPPGPRLLPRDAAAARPGRRPAAEPAAARARRADQRAGPAGHPRDPRPAAASQRGRHHGLPVLPPARRGRADVRPGRRPRPRPPGAAGAARRPAAADRAARRCAPPTWPGRGRCSTGRSRRTTSGS